jgi:5-methylcytosine-specific restriction endonuclease McrA
LAAGPGTYRRTLWMVAGVAAPMNFADAPVPRLMSAMKSRRAARSRDELRRLLGGRCSQCSSTGPLEFDCIFPRGAYHHMLPWPARIRFYWQEHLVGNLQLLCRACHTRKTAADNSKVRAATTTLL